MSSTSFGLAQFTQHKCLHLFPPPVRPPTHTDGSPPVLFCTAAAFLSTSLTHAPEPSRQIPSVSCPFSETEVSFQLQRVSFIIIKGNAVSPNYLLPLWSPFVGLLSPASRVPDKRLPDQPGCAFSFTFSILSSLSHSSSQVWSLLTLLRPPPPKHHLCFFHLGTSLSIVPISFLQVR